MATAARMRTVLWTLHRWIGIGFALLLVPIAVSGALLVWHDNLDAVIALIRRAEDTESGRRADQSRVSCETPARGHRRRNADGCHARGPFERQLHRLREWRLYRLRAL